MANPILPGPRGVVARLATRLRFPWLFALTLVLFVVDTFLLDPIPLLDEILLGLAAALFWNWRARRQPAGERTAGDTIDIPPSAPGTPPAGRDIR